MITFESYKNRIGKGGTSLGSIRKSQSDSVINSTFNGDPTYRKVRVLTPDGWQLYDAKYQFHVAQSITKDVMDYYLQFRPGVEFSLGTYVIIPNEIDDETHTFEEEKEWFSVKNRKDRIGNKDRSQLWFIVSRDSANAYVRYCVLQCNWNFQQVYDNKIMSCIGCSKNANSYTSGIQSADHSVSLDNLTAVWLPNLHFTYGDLIKDFGLDDNRTITHGDRFLLTVNDIHPSVYEVSKVVDTAPPGIIKLSLKQADFDYRVDDIDLKICDYHKHNGDSNIIEPVHYENNVQQIIKMILDSNNELGEYSVVTMDSISIGSDNYYGLKGYSGNTVPTWDIKLVPESADSNHPNSYYENLMRIKEIDNTSILLKPGKAKSIIGKRFILSAYDTNGNAYSSVTLEVTNAA